MTCTSKLFYERVEDVSQQICGVKRRKWCARITSLLRVFRDIKRNY